MDIVEEGLSASIHAAHPIGPASYTFTLQQHNMHSAPTYAHAEPM